jgi:hypothetical protein
MEQGKFSTYITDSKHIFVGRERRTRHAKPVAGVSKYGGQTGKCNLQGLELPGNIRQDLEAFGNHGIARGTWSSYTTAKKMLEQCCRENSITFDWPVSEKTILVFVHWLLKVRKVGGSTVESYLAGIRCAHIAKGLPAPQVRTDLVNLIIRGKKNLQAAERRAANTQSRQPVTQDILALLKARLRVWDAPAVDRRLVWAVATVCFHGAFRLGELLCKSERVFDPQYVLLDKDMDIDMQYRVNKSKGVLRLRLKSPKEDKMNRSLIVDVFGSGSNLCPVKALKSWLDAGVEREAEGPLFCLSSGAPLTPKKFIQIVRSQLKGYLEDENTIAGHSFRIGLASMLASLGYSETDIKAMGRWSSRAWLEYVKHPRTLRIAVARNVGLD